MIPQLLEPEVVEHPRRRGECQDGPRPCPLVGCRYNTYLEVGRNGSIKILHRGRLPEDVPPNESCSLDVSDNGFHTLDQVAKILGVTRERIRQIERGILLKMRKISRENEL